MLTSNRTRELNDALKRRCLYLWIDYPSVEKEREIILERIPELPADLANSIAQVMQALRAADFYKRPGIAETLDWSRALLGLEVRELDAEVLEETAGLLLKNREDIERLREIGGANLLASQA